MTGTPHVPQAQINTYIAQNAAEQITRDRGAACGNTGFLWDDAEIAHRQARSEARRNEAAAPAMRLCARCPVLGACAVLAQADHYTGLIAGGHYVDGELKTNFIAYQQLPA